MMNQQRWGDQPLQQPIPSPLLSKSSVDGMTSRSIFKSTTTSAEAEAMSLFRDLDKGLRSTVLSQQCESIVRFSDLILKYPLPTIANTALLRLAEFFRSSDNNFVRYWILIVFTEVRGEFDKVLNKNELTKRISSVLGSNDPIARALSLRTLAAMSDILSERIDLQHKIETSLWSCVDDVEREASITAIEQICATSKRFASHLLPEMQKLVHDVNTPLHSKLQLIRIFRHMHGTAAMAKKAFDTCADLIQAYPSKDFVLTILDTVSQLAFHNFIVAREVLSLLFALLEKDVRKAVKIQCLKDIILLSKKLSDPFTITYPASVIDSMLVDSPFEPIKLLLLKLLKTLSASPVMVKQWFAKNPDMITVCQHFLFHAQSDFVDHSTALLINIARHSNDQPLVNHLGNVLKASLYMSIEQRKNDKFLCEYIIRFVGTFPDTISMDLTERVTSKVIQCAEADDSASVLLYSLCLLKYTNRETTQILIAKHSQQILRIIDMLLRGSESTYSSAVRNLMVALLQAQRRGATDASFIERMKKVILELTNAQWLWTTYEIAKHAAALGYHNLTMSIFVTVASTVENELYYFWNMSLSKLCTAEYELSMVGRGGQNSQAYSLRSALINYNSALMDIQNCLTSVSSRFQIDFIQLRISYCTLIQNILLHIRNVGNTICEATKSKFVKMSDEISALANKCRSTVFSYFDIDDQSQTLLCHMELQCTVIAQSILTLSDSTNLSSNQPAIQVNNKDKETNEISLLCHKISTMLENVPESISLRMNMLQTIVLSSLGIGFSLPKFYYQTQLNTSLRMEVEVNGKNIQKSTATFVTTAGVGVEQGLAIRFSGYIQHEETKQKVKRRPKAVRICIRQAQRASPSEEDQQQPFFGEKEIIVSIINNSFQVQSMCHFENEGKYRLNINTQIIDEDDMYWNTLASERILIHVKSTSNR